MKSKTCCPNAGRVMRVRSALWIFALWAAGFVYQAEAAAPQHFVSDLIAAKLKNPRIPLDPQLLAAHGLRIHRRVHRIPWIILQIKSKTAVERLVTVLEERAAIEIAEPVFLRRTSSVPLDEFYSSQWSLNQTLRAEAAWEQTTGSGAVVAVLDTGVKLDHVDLASNLWINTGEIPGDGLDNDANGYVDDVNGADTFDIDGDPSDDVTPCTDALGTYWPGHGTAVAGLIAGVRHDSGLGDGIVGLAYGAKVMAVRVLGHLGGPVPACGVGTTISIADGIIYAADHGAHIINLSLGGTGESQMERDAIDYALEKGCLLVAAAGNEGARDLLFPARYLPVIGVGATDRQDGLADYSNTGKGLDFVAPGGLGQGPPMALSDLRLAWYGPDFVADGWVITSGTSFSAPLVSALAALLVGQGWTDSEGIRLRMIQTAIDLRDPGWDEETGYGRIDPARATGVEVLPGPNSFSSGRSAFPKNPMAYPNPFYPGKDPHSVLTFSAEARVEAKIQIFDQENLLVWETILPASDVGAYNEIPWDGRNGRQNSVGTGVYIIVVRQASRVDYGKIAIIGR